MESEIAKFLEPMEAALTREKEAVYSSALLEIDRSLADFDRNQIDLAQVLGKLAEYQPPPQGSELAILLEEIRQSQMTDTPVEIEIKKIAGQIFSALKNQPLNPEARRELQEFNGNFQEFRTGRTTPQAFAFYLRELAKKHGVRVKVSRRLAYLTGHQKRLKDIEGTRLFGEFRRYANSVKESLFQNDRQKALDIKTRGLDLMKRLARLELSFEDWEKVQKLTLRPDQWTATQDPVVSREEISILLNKMEPHLAFYHVAEKRDKALLENIRSMMTKAKQESSLVVAGGFHTEGLTRELKKKGISYVLVMPRIGSIPEEPLYREHMRGQVSWSDYFEVKDGKVNLYDAFVRATRDKLLGDKNALATGGKEWRDQIIRDLASEGRITEAGDYTRFIDERTGTPNLELQALREQWLANIDRFGEGLRKLHAEGNLSESSIMQLIKTITIPEVSLANQLAPGGRAEVRLLPLIQGPESSSIARRERPETRRSEIQAPSAQETRSEIRADLLGSVTPVRREGQTVQAAPATGRMTIRKPRPNECFYHGGLGREATLEDVDLNRLDTQQNKTNRTYGGFYLASEASLAWAKQYAKKRDGSLHRLTFKPSARIMETDNIIDRLSQTERDAFSYRLMR